ncbi:helix-turn-helix domain-containing protein [Roseivivax sp. CAU 1761]
MDDENWYGPDAATFGDRLAAARDAAQMSQEDLARRLGVKVTLVQSWEEDRAEPRTHRLQSLSGMLNVSMAWLLSGEGEGLSPPADEPDMADLRALLIDLREIQTDMRRTAERVGRLEKRLRRAMSEAGI